MTARGVALSQAIHDLRAEVLKLGGAVFTVFTVFVGIVIGTSDKHDFFGLGWLGSVILIIVVTVGIPALWFLFRSGIGSYKISELSLVETYADLTREVRRIVDDAKSILVATGSRNRDQDYLGAIVSELRSEPKLVHYRVLFGNPRYEVFKDHLKQLLAVRNPQDHPFGNQTLYMSCLGIGAEQAEWFVVANESR